MPAQTARHVTVAKSGKATHASGVDDARNIDPFKATRNRRIAAVVLDQDARDVVSNLKQFATRRGLDK